MIPSVTRTSSGHCMRLSAESRSVSAPRDLSARRNFTMSSEGIGFMFHPPIVSVTGNNSFWEAGAKWCHRSYPQKLSEAGDFNFESVLFISFGNQFDA